MIAWKALLLFPSLFHVFGWNAEITLSALQNMGPTWVQPRTGLNDHTIFSGFPSFVRFFKRQRSFNPLSFSPVIYQERHRRTYFHHLAVELDTSHFCNFLGWVYPHIIGRGCAIQIVHLVLKRSRCPHSFFESFISPRCFGGVCGWGHATGLNFQGPLKKIEKPPQGQIPKAYLYFLIPLFFFFITMRSRPKSSVKIGGRIYLTADQ